MHSTTPRVRAYNQTLAARRTPSYALPAPVAPAPAATVRQVQPARAAAPRLSSADFPAWLKTLPIPWAQLNPSAREAASKLFQEMVRSARGPASGMTTLTVEGVLVS